jgi:alpha-ketoglutarate-dependent 2,4-dichlorophenoxyacetate dioxygenase
MAISIRRVHPLFVGEVSGVDLRLPLTSEESAAIEAGMDRYAVLVFHDQNITDQQQVAFSRNFGEIENSTGGTVTKPHEKRLSHLMNDVSNLGQDNKPLARDDRRRLFNLGNQLWHSDSSFRAIPAKYSLLSGRVVVEKGGNTEFADVRAAYDALDDETKQACEPLICEHSLLYSRGLLGFDVTEEAPEPGSHPSHHRAQIAVPGVARRHDRWVANAGGTRLLARAGRARDPAAIRLFA